jgi:carboxylesterase type B
VGSALNHGPHYLMDREIVLVTVNYRLGPFGFLAVGTKEATGNMGLKDQVLALRWVQRNIANFGGDPGRVTISGLSAGAFSVTSHIVSEMSAGLFHRVIAMSGSQAFQQIMQTEYLDFAKKIAAELDCSVNNVEDMMACLRQVRYHIKNIITKYNINTVVGSS